MYCVNITNFGISHGDSEFLKPKIKNIGKNALDSKYFLILKKMKNIFQKAIVKNMIKNIGRVLIKNECTRLLKFFSLLTSHFPCAKGLIKKQTINVFIAPISPAPCDKGFRI